jgi:hypothetical protein
MNYLMMISCWSKHVGVLLSFSEWHFKLMFYYIEVHLLAHYIQWIKMHGETVKSNLMFFRDVSKNLCRQVQKSSIFFRYIFELLQARWTVTLNSKYYIAYILFTVHCFVWVLYAICVCWCGAETAVCLDETSVLTSAIFCLSNEVCQHLLTSCTNYFYVTQTKPNPFRNSHKTFPVQRIKLGHCLKTLL